MVFAALKDVPANHWAAPAINSLVSKGIINGYPDGTYRGKAFITRYQIAVILDKAVNYLESPLNSLQEKVKNLTNTVLTLNDYSSFLNTQQMAMQDRMDSMTATITSIKNELSGVEGFNNDISFLYKKLGILSDQMKGFASEDEVSSLKDTVSAVFKTVSVNNQQTNDSITGLSNLVYSNKDKLMDLSSKTAKLESSISSLESKLGNTPNDLDLIYTKLAALKELQFNQTDAIKKLQDSIDSLNNLSASVKDNQAAINSVALSLGSTLYNLQDTVSANGDAISKLQSSVKDTNANLTKVSSDVASLKGTVNENSKTAKSASSMAVFALILGIVGTALGAYAIIK
jgi:chromosome segregation ATPase